MSKAITKEAARLRRPFPNPEFGPMVELDGSHLHWRSSGPQRHREGTTPPALLQVQPACAFGNEDVLDARMVCEPRAGLQAAMAAQIIRDDENISGWIVCFDLFEEPNVVLGIARGRTTRDLLTIADPQCSIDPHFVIPTAVPQRGLDAMAILRPVRCWREGARDYRSQFVGVDGRRSRWWLDVVDDDRRSFWDKVFIITGPQL